MGGEQQGRLMASAPHGAGEQEPRRTFWKRSSHSLSYYTPVGFKPARAAQQSTALQTDTEEIQLANSDPAHRYSLIGKVKVSGFFSVPVVHD